LSNSSSLIHLTYPEDSLHPKAGEFCFENNLDEAQLVRGQLASYAAALPGVSFAFTFSVFLCVECRRGSFVGIVMAQWLPGASTMSMIPTFSLASFGIMIILIITSKITTLPSHR
jgi:hypothetical protein